jgi:outer membrane protein assembly factor BamB
MPCRTRLAVFGLITLAMAATLDAFGPTWPAWRGPDGQGISDETSLPTEWSPTKNVLWSTPIPGRGFSSPIVWNTTIFVTTAIEGDVIPGAGPARHMLEGEPFVHPDAVPGDRRQTLKVMALDADTGKVLWDRVAYDGPTFDARHKAGSFANTTPVTDGTLVYAWFGSEGLYAYDFSGRLRWKKSLGKIPTLGLGTASSPVLHENLLILQCDEDEGARSFIVALDKRNGKEVWRAPRKVQASWSSPVIARGSTRTELVTSGSEFIISYDPRTGKELWRVLGTGGWTVPTPIVAHDIVIASAASPKKRAVAVRLGGSGDVTGTKQVVWERDRGTGYTPSSIAYGNYAYILTDAGLLTCVDIRTGEVQYEGARPPKPARFSSSPIAFDGKILISDEQGDTYVIAAGPKFEILAGNTLDEPINASPAAANGRLYIRTATKLYSLAAGR